MHPIDIAEPFFDGSGEVIQRLIFVAEQSVSAGNVVVPQIRFMSELDRRLECGASFWEPLLVVQRKSEEEPGAATRRLFSQAFPCASLGLCPLLIRHLSQRPGLQNESLTVLGFCPGLVLNSRRRTCDCKSSAPPSVPKKPLHCFFLTTNHLVRVPTRPLIGKRSS